MKMVGRITAEENQEIERVHRRIEYCMMHYMTKRQTIDCLASQANIEPFFTETIWEQLEVEEPEFFRAYYTRLVVRDQIVRFNQALSLQAQLMRQQNCNNGLPCHSYASQQRQQHNSNNVLLHHSNGSQVLMHQQQPLMHQQQHNGSNGLLHRSNASQPLMHHSNGVQHHSNGVQHRSNGSIQQHNGSNELLHRHQQHGSNGLQHHSNGSHCANYKK